MIQATAPNGHQVRVDGLVNRGGWFGKTWLIGLDLAPFTTYVVVEADCASDAIDELTDHPKWGERIKLDDPSDACDACQREDFDNCSCTFAGNEGHRVDLDVIGVLTECQVNYFAKSNC